MSASADLARLRVSRLAFSAMRLTIAATFALGSATIVAQDQPTPLFRTRADIVRVDVLATSSGRPIDNLATEDFELFDNGVRQQAQLASIDDLEIDVVLALDVSASVRAGCSTTLREAAGALVGTLRPGDRAAVITFANAVVIRTPLTADHTRCCGRWSRSTRAAARRSSTPPTPAWP